MRWTLVLVALVISGLFLTSAVIQPWYDPDTIDLKVQRLTGIYGYNNRVNYSISNSIYSDPVNIILVPVARYGIGDVFIFLEKDNVTLEVYAMVLGLYDHLRAEMRNLRMNQSVKVIDHAQTVDVLNGEPAVLMIVNSTMNWNEQSNTMLSWVKKGGVIIGIGKGALPFVTENSTAPSTDGLSEFQVRYESLDYASGDGVSMSGFASALDMKYISPKFGMRVADLQNYGRAVGFLYQRSEPLTSAGLILNGAGSIILISGIMIQPFAASMEDVLAQDLARMFACGLPWSVGEPYIFKVDGREGSEGSFSANITDSDQVVCFAYSTASYQHRYRIQLA